MPDTISSPSPSLAAMRFQEPYVTQGLNKKLNGLAPPGVIRGGKLETVGAGLNIRIVADPDYGDSVYSYVDVSGHQITFRQVGNVNLDLSGVSGLPTDVYIALYIDYSVSAATVVEWRAYTIAELTTAPVAESAFVIVLGRVAVPAAGPIAASAFSPELRREAGLRPSTELREWQQVLNNSDFELAISPGINLATYDGVMAWSSLSGGTNYDTFVSATSPLTGSHEIEYRADGVGAISDVTAGEHATWFRASPGDFVKIACDIRGLSWTAVGASGFFGVRVLWYDNDFTFLSLQDVVGIDSSYSGTFAYTHFEDIIDPPATARWARIRIVFDTDSVVPNDGEALFLDNVKVWVKRSRFDIDTRDRDVAHMGGEVIAQTLALGPDPSDPASRLEYISNTVYRQNVGNTAGVGGELIELLIEALRGDVLSNPIKGFLTRMYDGWLQMEHLQDSESAREIGFINTFSYDASGEKDLTFRHAWGTPTVQTDVGSLRLYTSNVIQGGARQPGFEVTFNCFYDTSASLWNREEVGVDAWMIALTQEGIFIYFKEAGPGTWTDSGWAQASGFPFLDIALGLGTAGLIRMNGTGSFPASFSIPSNSRLLAPATGWLSADGVDILNNTVVKAHGQVLVDNAGTVTFDGYNFTAIRIANQIIVTIISNMANATYSIVGSVSDDGGSNQSEFVSFSALGVGSFVINQYDDTGTSVVLGGGAGTGRKYSFIIFGDS